MKKAMKRLAQQYPRYGYRRIRIFLKREGHTMSWQRAHRLWKAAGLQLPQRRPRRPVATSRPRPLPPFAPSSVWAYDFVFDGCANGQRLKCLTVIDEFTRECLAIGHRCRWQHSLQACDRRAGPAGQPTRRAGVPAL